MLPYLPVGPFLLQLPGVALLAGIWFGLALVEKAARALRLNPQDLYNLVVIGLAAGIGGARLGYAARYASAYAADPLSLLALNPNTLLPSVGLALGLAAAILYGRKKKLPLRPTLDSLASGLALFMVFLALAHLLSGDAYGEPARLPWSIYLWDDYRHPSQIYELLAALGIWLLVWRRPPARAGAGFNFLVLIALTAAARLVLEAFRGDSELLAGGFRTAQLVSLTVLMLILALMRKWADEAAPGA